jgi:hypothetical protein
MPNSAAPKARKGSAVLVVVGSRFDVEAKALVAKWSPWDAALLECEDLSRAGWVASAGDWPASTAVVSGSVVHTKNIRGVLTRRRQVFDAELSHVAPLDRQYVAGEMTSFLMYWLSLLPCAVLNRPKPASLSGPNWSRQQWVHTAAHCDMRVRPHRTNTCRSTEESDSSAGEIVQVTVVGARCFGAPNEEVAALARRLALAAGTAFLEVRFKLGEGSPTFLNADPFPKLSDDAIADAVLDMLLRGNVQDGIAKSLSA